MTAALLLAYFAQLFYDAAFEGPLFIFLLERFPRLLSDRGQLMAGTIAYALAMILFAVAAPALPPLAGLRRDSPDPAPRRPYPGELPPDARIIRPHVALGRPAETKRPTGRPAAQPAAPIAFRWRLLLLALAVLPYALSMLRFARQGEDALVRWLWLGGLGIFLVGQVIWPALRRTGDARAEHSPAFHWPQVAVLTLILLAAFWLRFNRLETIPDDLHGDMASMGLQARDWLASSERSLFHEGWANIPILGFLPAAFGLRLFGDNLFGLNMSAVVAGMLSLLGLYLLTWRLFDSHRLAALALAILAVNIPHIHFSRLAAYMDPWPFALFGAFFLLDGLRARRPQSLALAGLLLGLGLQLYYSGRVIVVILACAFLYLLLVRRQWLRENWLGLGLALAAIVLTLGPNLIYYYRFPEPFLERSRAVWLFFEPVMTHLKGKYGLQTPMQVLWQQTKLSLLMFNRAIDSSTQFGFPHPMFSSLLSPLVVLGAGYSLRRWRHPGLGLNFVWLLVMVVNGSILTGDAPFWPRLVGVLPAAALVAALPLDRLWTALSQLPAPGRRRAAELLLTAAAVALLVLAGRQNWNQYYEAVKNNARSQAFVGRFLYPLPTHIAACMFSDPMALQVRETYFLAWPRQTVDLPADAANGLIERCPGPPFVWILTPNHLGRLPLLQQRWPSGRIQDHFYGTGAPAFTSYTVLEGAAASEVLPSATPAPGEPPQVPPDQLPLDQPQPGAPAAPIFPAYTAAGAAFSPEQTFLGNTDSSVWEISLGEKEVRDGDFRLHVGPAPGHDAAYDYVELRAQDGSRYRFEAEDASATSGDSYAEHEGIDGHWWLQAYGPFSGGQGLIAHKGEAVPALITAAAAPAGIYEVVIGSFGGDPANGVFGLGLTWEP
jgi:4-amino-4-deoxy-L-arabinose transferase-like glycosyltransferase